MSVSLWSKYKVIWTFHTPIFGSMPASEDVLVKWVEQQIKRGRLRPSEGESIEELRDRAIREAAELLPTEKELLEERTLVFERPSWEEISSGPHPWAWASRNSDNKVIAFFGGNIRSHLKECARTLSSLVMAKAEGVKSLSVRFLNGTYVAEDWVPVIKEGRFLTLGNMGKPFSVHAIDFRTGVRLNSLKKCEGISPPSQVVYTLKIMNKIGGKEVRPIVTEEELGLVMEYGGTHGYGQERGRGYGRYTFEFERIE